MKLNIEDLLAIKQMLRNINSTPMEEIEIYENGSILSINPELIERYLDTGLNNVDVILFALKKAYVWKD